MGATILGVRSQATPGDPITRTWQRVVLDGTGVTPSTTPWRGRPRWPSPAVRAGRDQLGRPGPITDPTGSRSGGLAAVVEVVDPEELEGGVPTSTAPSPSGIAGRRRGRLGTPRRLSREDLDTPCCSDSPRSRWSR